MIAVVIMRSTIHGKTTVSCSKIFFASLTQRRSCASQHLRHIQTSEQIKQVQLIFEGAAVLQKLLVKQTELAQLIPIKFYTDVTSMNSYSTYFASYSKHAHTGK